MRAWSSQQEPRCGQLSPCKCSLLPLGFWFVVPDMPLCARASHPPSRYFAWRRGLRCSRRGEGAAGSRDRATIPRTRTKEKERAGGQRGGKTSPLPLGGCRLEPHGHGRAKGEDASAHPPPSRRLSMSLTASCACSHPTCLFALAHPTPPSSVLARRRWLESSRRGEGAAGSRDRASSHLRPTPTRGQPTSRLADPHPRWTPRIQGQVPNIGGTWGPPRTLASRRGRPSGPTPGSGQSAIHNE